MKKEIYGIATKVALKGKFVTIQAYLKKQEKSRTITLYT